MLHLDANRGEIDVYNMGWKAYLSQRETDERRRKRARTPSPRPRRSPTGQQDAGQGRKRATAAQSMLKRAEKMMAGLEGERQADKVARIWVPRLPPARPRSPPGSSKSYGPLEVFTDVDL